MSHHPAPDSVRTVMPDAPAPLPAWPAGVMREVGQSRPRVSALDKVIGRCIYASDIVLPGMVHAVLLRSTIAHGRVLGLDVAAAAAVPGVLAVLGSADIAWPAYPPRGRASVADEVRFVGEEIGAVVAVTEAAAREAARLVVVHYEVAPACVSLEQALAAPVLANDVEIIERGDLGAARASAEVTITQRYSTEAQHHNTLEPHGCVAAWENDCLTWWDSNQGGHLIREWGARALGMPVDQVRVVSPYAGGGFGSKITLKPYHLIAAALARQLSQPVRLFMARGEEFIASHQRAPTQRQIAVGARRDGHLCFIDEQVTGQAGPCRFMSKNAGGAANGLRLHRVDAVRAELRQLLTNTQYPTPFRGPNVAEDMFCLEQAIDEMAHALKMDPLQLRLSTLLRLIYWRGCPMQARNCRVVIVLGRTLSVGSIDPLA